MRPKATVSAKPVQPDGPYAYHEETELTIDTLTNLGHGLGRVDGWVIMVPFTVPGERVRVRVWRNHKNYSEADLMEVIEVSPDRVKPQCPLFGTCGGCQYQHMAREAQLRWKRAHVIELLERLAGAEAPQVNATLATPEGYGYRSKLTPHYQKPRKGKPLDIGFLMAGARRIVDVPQCPIATEGINATLPVVRDEVEARREQLRRGGTLLIRDTLEEVVTNPKAEVEQQVRDQRFRYVAGEFFQNNPYMIGEMVGFALDRAATPGARFLVDAYCGAGVFAICGADRFERCLGVDVNPASIRLAQANIALNAIDNCRFIEGNAEAILHAVDFPAPETSVIIDPPRKGCDETFLNQLFQFGPNRVVYVSCDPATQARDLKAFLANGYRVVEVQPVDLFPQTRHIENIAVLDRADG